MVESARMIAGSAGAGVTGLALVKSGCAQQTGPISARNKNNPAFTNRIDCSPNSKVVLRCRILPLDRRLQSISNYEYHPAFSEGVTLGIAILQHETPMERERRLPCLIARNARIVLTSRWTKWKKATWSPATNAGLSTRWWASNPWS